MTKVKLHAPVAEMHGEFEKNSGIIMRQKKYRAPNGAVLKVGVQESYKIAHPRDFDRTPAQGAELATPAQGAELANMRSFGEVSRMTTEIIRSERYTDEELAAMTPEERAHIAELRLRLENYRTRFYAQFKNPDPEAPFEKKLRPGASKLYRKQYSKLDTFIQAIRQKTAINN